MTDITKIYYLFDDGGKDTGEIEGMFDEDLNLIGTWCSNDAHWRNEYFSPFMKNIGIEVVRAPDHYKEKLIKTLRLEWNEVYGDDE